MRGRRSPPETLSRLADLARSGRSVSQIARELLLARSTVLAHWPAGVPRLAGRPGRPRKPLLPWPGGLPWP